MTSRIAEQDSFEEKLREACVDWNGEQISDDSTPRYEISCGIIREVADTLARYRDALAPFAEAANGLGETWSDNCLVCQHANVAPTLNFGHLRKARAALNTTKIEKE